MKLRSKFVAVIAGGVGVALLIACYAVQTKPAAAAQGAAGADQAKSVRVHDTPGLVAAIKAARGGDTILLEAGRYATLDVSNVNIKDGQLTIASATPSSPASLAGAEIADSSGVTLRNLDFGLNPRTQSVMNVVSSQNIRLEKLDFHVAPQSDKSGLLFRFSTDVSVENSTFRDMGTGIRSGDSKRVTISRNRFSQMRGDGIQSNGTSSITIAGNHFTDFHVAPGDHPDAIQFFTLNQKAPTRDITIVDNVIVRGAGDIIQGIFMGDEAKQPYVDVKIARNTVIGAMYNGIAIGGGQNVSITDNVVQAYKDQDSWIHIGDSSNVSVSNNQAFALIYQRNVALTEKANKKIRAVKVGDISALTAPPSDK